MKALFSLLLVALLSIQVTAQDATKPEATRILNKAKALYDSYASMEASFDLIIELPEQGEEVQSGKLIQKGEMYVLDIADKAIYNDSKALWVHMKKNKEVQLNDIDMEDEESIMSPKDMLMLYESGDYDYRIVDRPVVDGKKNVQIDFKPLDKDSEYFRILLWLDAKSRKMNKMQIFAKDGSKYALKIKDLIPNKSYDDSIFTFPKDKYPDVYIEDLRID